MRCDSSSEGSRPVRVSEQTFSLPYFRLCAVLRDALKLSYAEIRDEHTT